MRAQYTIQKKRVIFRRKICTNMKINYKKTFSSYFYEIEYRILEKWYYVMRVFRQIEI